MLGGELRWNVGMQTGTDDTTEGSIVAATFAHGTAQKIGSGHNGVHDATRGVAALQCVAVYDAERLVHGNAPAAFLGKALALILHEHVFD